MLKSRGMTQAGDKGTMIHRIKLKDQCAALGLSGDGKQKGAFYWSEVHDFLIFIKFICQFDDVLCFVALINECDVCLQCFSDDPIRARWLLDS